MGIVRVWFLKFCWIATLGLVFECLVFSQAIPQISDVIAVMQDAPRKGQGLRLIDANNKIHFARTVYHVLKPSCLVEVYVSSDPWDYKLGPSNVQMRPLMGKSRVSGVEYQVLQGKPSYWLGRTDGLWFLLVFPDEPVDVSLFVRRFGECYGFFEQHLPNGSIETHLPAVLGSLTGNP